MTPHVDSIAFHAACNEAVDASMRPVRQRVIYRLAQLFGSEVPHGYTKRQQEELKQLFEDIERQVGVPPSQPEHSVNGRTFLDSKFVELIGKDPRWRAIVLEEVVQERQWSDLWNKLFEGFSDKMIAFFEKLVSPEHPVAKGATGIFTGVAALVLAIWLNGKLFPDTYKSFHIPVQIEFQGEGKNIPVKISIDPKGDSDIHLKAILDPNPDPNALNAVIKPVIRQDAIAMTLNPKIDASLKITPEIQCPSEESSSSGKLGSKPCGLPIHFFPGGDLSLFPLIPEGNIPLINVSVRELRGQSPPSSDTKATGIPHAGAPSESMSLDTFDRPLDKISENLTTLNTNLGELGSELQASNGNGKSNLNLAALQKTQNLIHSNAINQDRAVVVEANSNTIHSVVLQWFDGGPEPKPQSCTVKFKVNDVNANDIHLLISEETCSGDLAVQKKLPLPIDLHAGELTDLGHWNLSIDETHHHWVFLHAATLRFTWKPADNNSIAQNATGSI